VASVVLFNVASLVCAAVVLVAASASAAFFAVASVVFAAVVVVPGSSFSPCLFLASPNIEPEASVLPLPDVCSDTVLLALAPIPPVAALDAAPTDAACAGTAPCAPLSAASAACNASVTDVESAEASLLPGCVPSVAVPLAVPDAAAVVLSVGVRLVSADVSPDALAAFAWSCACACNCAATAATAGEVVVLSVVLFALFAFGAAPPWWRATILLLCSLPWWALPDGVAGVALLWLAPDVLALLPLPGV
jgi:hypothetical protein